jgi:hypothetical protein
MAEVATASAADTPPTAGRAAPRAAQPGPNHAPPAQVADAARDEAPGRGGPPAPPPDAVEARAPPAAAEVQAQAREAALRAAHAAEVARLRAAHAAEVARLRAEHGVALRRAVEAGWRERDGARAGDVRAPPATVEGRVGATGSVGEPPRPRRTRSWWSWLVWRGGGRD